MGRSWSVTAAIGLVTAGAGGANGQDSGGTPATREVRVCEVVDGEAREITRMATPADDTVYGGGPATGPGYATSAAWFIDNEPITFHGRRYVKYGVPRVLAINEVSRAGEYRGVSAFWETETMSELVIYVPVRPGCEFQPYVASLKAPGVRG